MSALKEHFAENNPNMPITARHISAAVTAGAMGDIVTNPFWVARTRIQTLYLHPESTLTASTGTVAMMRTIYRTEGVRAFFKGLGASLLGLTHVGLQFPLCKYECMHVCM